MRPPLGGRTVLVAASEERTKGLAAALESLGARVIPFPTVRIAAPTDSGPLDAALRRWRSYDWVVFTSTNGVDAVRSRGRALRLELSAHPPRIAAVGPATKAAAQSAGFPVDAMPKAYLTRAIPGVLGSLRGRRVLLARSELATDTLAARLRDKGAYVDDVDAYAAVLAAPELSPLGRADAIDLVVFTSPSSVRNLTSILPPRIADRIRASAKAACIGPVTAKAARASGFRIGEVAREHTGPGLVRGIQEVFARG